MPPGSHRRIDSFGKVAPCYDAILDLISFGMYARFLRRAVEILAPRKGERILDLCSGTGRVASWIAQAVGKEGEVVGMDISKGMVEWTKNRYGGLKKVMFLHKDVTKSWEYQNYFDGIFTPLESPGIYAGDVINRKHQLLVKAGSKPHLSNGVYFLCYP